MCSKSGLPRIVIGRYGYKSSFGANKVPCESKVPCYGQDDLFKPCNLCKTRYPGMASQTGLTKDLKVVFEAVTNIVTTLQIFGKMSQICF